MASLINLKTISVFRIMIMVVLNCHFFNIYLFVLSCLYLLFIDRRELIIFAFLSLLIYLIDTYRFDFMPFGIVDYQNGKSYIVDKLFYKVRVNSDEPLRHGDILLFHSALDKTFEDNLISKNILYYGEMGEVIFNFFPRLLLEKRILLLGDEARAIINRLFFNLYLPLDLDYNLGYGLMSYYAFRFIYNRKPKLGLIMMIIYALLFTFEVKFLLLIGDAIFKKHFNKEDNFALKVIFLSLINRRLIMNYAIMLPLLFNLYSLFRHDLDFKTYLLLIESLLFGECGLVSIFLYHKLVIVKIAVFILSIVLLVFPVLEYPYLCLIKVYSFINSMDISLRGSLSVFSIIIFIMFKRFARFRNMDLKTVLLLVLIILPLNYPFTYISFTDVGQGDAIVIRKGFSPSVVMIDTGSPFNYHKLKSDLYRQGIYTVDHLIITHDDTDHCGNLDNLKKDFKIKDIITEGRDFSWKGLNFDFLDLGTYENDNDNSLVYYLNIDNKGFLFTGDISKKVDDAIIRKYPDLDIDFLKVSHHGSYSGSSERFIGYYQPEYAIISTNGLYGHPHETVLKNLRKYLVRYYITKQSGSIKIFFTSMFELLKTAHGEFVIIKE